MQLNTLSRNILPTICLLVITLASAGQGTMLLRQPTLSKQHIVFVHADDLWVVEKEGGDARRLTSAVGSETSPRLSPDGKWVAFTSQYNE